MTTNYAKRRQLREARDASKFAAGFFAVVAVVFVLAAERVGYFLGSDGDFWWWICMAVFMIAVVCSGAAVYHWVMANEELRG